MTTLITTLFSDYYYYQYKANHMWGKCRLENIRLVQHIEAGVEYFKKVITYLSRAGILISLFNGK